MGVLYKLLAAEFNLKIAVTPEAEIDFILSFLVENNLISHDKADPACFVRPPISSLEFPILKLLGQIQGLTFERYAVAAALLSAYGAGGELERAAFESNCQLISQRISLLQGLTSPEVNDASFFKKFVEHLKKQGGLEIAAEGKLKVLKGALDLSVVTRSLLKPDILNNIERMVQDGPRL